MQKWKKALAAWTAVSILIGVSPTAVVSADTIEIPKSTYLTDNTGTLSMTVSGGRAVRVKIVKDTPDGDILYYNTSLETDGTYHFTLDSCEYDFDTNAYDASFTVTVWDKIDRKTVYTQEGLIVVDPGVTREAACSQFDWNITLSEGEVQNTDNTVSAASIQDNVWHGSTDAVLQYVAYTTGDLNGDGEITSLDALLVLRYIAADMLGMDASLANEDSGYTETAAYSAADINLDGQITSFDVSCLLQYVASVGTGEDADWETITGDTAQS